MSSGSLKNPQQNVFTNIYLIYMYKENLALNNLKWLICRKTKPKQTIIIILTFIIIIITIIIIVSFPASFSNQLLFVVFHWNLNDSKSPRVSRTFLSILSDLNSAVISKVSILSLISNSSRLFSKRTNYNWYHCLLHGPQFFLFSDKV